MAGLLDRLGTGLAGAMPYDPEMLRSLGVDPEAMQREQGRMALMQFLAGMGGARAKGGASFGQALNEGLSSALQYRQGRQGQDVNQLYMLQNMKRTQAAAEAARAESAQEAKLAEMFGSDTFWQAQSPEMQQYRSIIPHLPPRQAVQLMGQIQTQIGQDKRQMALFDQQRALQDDRQSASEALAAQRQAAMLAAIGARAGAGGGGTSETERLMALLSDPAYAPDTEQGKALRTKLGLVGGPNDRTPAGVQQITAKTAKELQTGLTTAADLRQQLLEAQAMLDAGKVKTGAALGGVTNYGTIADSMSQLLSADQQAFLRLVNSGVLSKARMLPGSFTEREGLMTKLSGLNLSVDEAANKRTIAEALAQLDRGAAISNEQLALFQGGGSVLDIGPRNPTTGARVGDFGNVAGGAAAPAGPTPGTVEGGYRYIGGDPADPASWVKI